MTQSRKYMWQVLAAPWISTQIHVYLWSQVTRTHEFLTCGFSHGVAVSYAHSSGVWGPGSVH